MSSSLLSGRHALIFGFASRRSLAWAVAVAWARAGASLGFSLASAAQRPALESALAADLPSHMRSTVAVADVRDEAALAAACEALASTAPGGEVHAVLHAVAGGAPARGLAASALSAAPRDAWLAAHEVSSYSLLAVARGCMPALVAGVSSARAAQQGDATVISPATASIVSLSYLGSTRSVPGYGVMGAAKASLEATARGLAAELGPSGVRVNVLSAGPLPTLSARALPGFHDMRATARERSATRRDTTHGDVAGAATFLACEMSAGVTGHTLFVDHGVHAMF